jgi:hypothetical protein
MTEYVVEASNKPCRPLQIPFLIVSNQLASSYVVEHASTTTESIWSIAIDL